MGDSALIYCLISLIVVHLYALAHFGKAVGKVAYDTQLDIKAYGQVGVLVSRVNCRTDKDVDVGCLLEE